MDSQNNFVYSKPSDAPDCRSIDDFKKCEANEQKKLCNDVNCEDVTKSYQQITTFIQNQKKNRTQISSNQQKILELNQQMKTANPKLQRIILQQVNQLTSQNNILNTSIDVQKTFAQTHQDSINNLIREGRKKSCCGYGISKNGIPCVRKCKNYSSMVRGNYNYCGTSGVSSKLGAWDYCDECKELEANGRKKSYCLVKS